MQRLISQTKAFHLGIQIHILPKKVPMPRRVKMAPVKLECQKKTGVQNRFIVAGGQKQYKRESACNTLVSASTHYLIVWIVFGIRVTTVLQYSFYSVEKFSGFA